MDQRLEFVRDVMGNRVTMVELCARYGVSRRIGYKWLGRFAEDGRRTARAPCSGSRRALDGHRGRAARVRAGLSRVRAAAGDSHRQRRPVRDVRDPRALAPERLVDAPRHRAPAPSPGLPAGERRPRTHASHPQAARGQARPAHVRSAAQQKRFDAFRFEYHTERPHEALQLETLGEPVSLVAAPVPTAPPGARVPGTFPRETRDRRWHVPLSTPAPLHRERARRSVDRLGRNRRRRLVDLLQRRAVSDTRRARLCHPRLTPNVLPMSSDYSVTYLSGCSATPEARRLNN